MADCVTSQLAIYCTGVESTFTGSVRQQLLAVIFAISVFCQQEGDITQLKCLKIRYLIHPFAEQRAVLTRCFLIAASWSISSLLKWKIPHEYNTTAYIVVIVSCRMPMERIFLSSDGIFHDVYWEVFFVVCLITCHVSCDIISHYVIRRMTV